MIKFKCLVESVKWRRIVDNIVVTFVTSIVSLVKNVLLKMQSQQNKNFAMKKQLDAQKNGYDSKDYEIMVSLSDNKEYQSFNYAYCHLCSNKKMLKKSYWETYPVKFHKDVPLSSLIDNCDSLSQSWNQIEVLRCILPNDPVHILNSNAKMVLRPEQHWCSVQEENNSMRKSISQKQLTYVPVKSSSSTASSHEGIS